LPKIIKKNSGFISDPQRCEVCETVLTLYPHNFADCPHCGQRICRSCWEGTWAAKSFSAEKCLHLTLNDAAPGLVPVVKNRGIHWDWHKAIFIGLLGIAAVSIVLFLMNFFVF